MKGERELSLLIRRALPRADAEALSHRILQRYGSLASALETHAKDLTREEGLEESGAQLLGLIPQLGRYLRRAEASAIKSIRNARDAGRYLCAQYIGIHYERVLLLCLDETGRLLQNALMQEGSIDEAPFDLRNIAEIALRADARAVVLAHNHPGGDRLPSRADKENTARAIQTLNPLGLIVPDHIIIADGEAFSMREKESILASLFLQQDDRSALLRNWLD